MPLPTITRRQALAGAAAAAAGAAGWFLHDTTDEEATVQGIHHSPSPTASPSPGQPAPVVATQKISGTTRQSAIRIPEGTRLQFDPAANTTLEMTGNLIIEGVLEMKPNAGVTHILRFVGVRESAFVGGGNDPIASDVGLWVMGGGKLDLAARRVGAGLTVHGTPLGAGSRTVHIEGTPSGRSHVFIRSTKTAAQSVDGVLFRYMGVSKPIPGDPEGRKSIVPGRYALHFHRCGENSRGSVIQNCLIRDGENRAYVPHASHGITLRRNVAYNVKLDGFWWDPPDSSSDNASNDILIEDCIAAVVRNDLLFSTISGFTVPFGDRNVVRRCIATGVTQGGSDGIGFSWPRSGSGKWLMEDCVSHHNDQGAFFWTGLQQTVRRLRCYSNNYRDLAAGAYRSSNIFEDCRFESTPLSLTENGTSDTAGQHTFRRIVCLGAFEIPDVGVDGTVAAVKPVLVESSQLEGGILVNQPGVGGDNPTAHEFRNCTRAGRGLVLTDFTIQAKHARTRISVTNADGSSFQIP